MRTRAGIRLTDWQADCLGMVREESYYFAPQGMTKVMNEGWACVRAETLVGAAKWGYVHARCSAALSSERAAQIEYVEKLWPTE